MGWCHEFGPQIRPGCDHPMVADAQACRCPECAVVCEGRFAGCAQVWARGPVTVTLQRAAVPEGGAALTPATPGPAREASRSSGGRRRDDAAAHRDAATTAVPGLEGVTGLRDVADTVELSESVTATLLDLRRDVLGLQASADALDCRLTELEGRARHVDMSLDTRASDVAHLRSAVDETRGELAGLAHLAGRVAAAEQRVTAAVAEVRERLETLPDHLDVTLVDTVHRQHARNLRVELAAWTAMIIAAVAVAIAIVAVAADF